MSKSIYSSWSCYVQNDFTKSINSNQFLKLFVQKAFAIVFVRKCYSYEINVENSNCLPFKIAISWLEIWNEIARIQRKTLFRIDFSVAISHVKFLATMFDDKINKTRRKKFIVTIVYWNFHYAKLIQNNRIIYLLYRLQN